MAAANGSAEGRLVCSISKSLEELWYALRCADAVPSAPAVVVLQDVIGQLDELKLKLTEGWPVATADSAD